MIRKGFRGILCDLQDHLEALMIRKGFRGILCDYMYTISSHGCMNPNGIHFGLKVVPSSGTFGPDYMSRSSCRNSTPQCCCLSFGSAIPSIAGPATACTCSSYSSKISKIAPL